MRRRRPRLTPEQILGSRPVRNQNLETEEIDGGGLRIITQRRSAWWIRGLSVILPIPRERRTELDEIGRQVWELCDGGHTLKDMIEVFQKRHKLTRAEAEWSLRRYLRDLGRRGLLGFAVETRKSHE